MLDLLDYRLKFARPLSCGEAAHLRGYFGARYADEVCLHHHRPDGGFVYEYPRVQFKVLDRAAHLLGIAEGGPVVVRLWSEVEKARLQDGELPVVEATLGRRREAFGECDEPITYRLRTPWLALNQENHARFRCLRTDAERRGVLERILPGNCLSLAKSFGHRVQARLQADAQGLRPVEARLKGVPMLAFLGVFRINFLLPNLLGIGKSVSRGFGTVERVAGGASC
jgi:hypothetical protein